MAQSFYSSISSIPAFVEDHDNLDQFLINWLPRNWSYIGPASLQKYRNGIGCGARFPSGMPDTSVVALKQFTQFLLNHNLVEPHQRPYQQKAVALDITNALCEVWTIVFLQYFKLQTTITTTNTEVLNPQQTYLQTHNQLHQLGEEAEKIQNTATEQNNQWQFIFQPLINAKITAAELQEFFKEPEYQSTDGRLQRRLYQIPQALLPIAQTWFEYFSPVYHQPRANCKQQSFFKEWSIELIQQQNINNTDRFIMLPLYLRMYNVDQCCESTLHCNALVLDMHQRVMMRWDSNGAHGTGPTQGRCYIPVIQVISTSKQKQAIKHQHTRSPVASDEEETEENPFNTQKIIKKMKKTKTKKSKQ
jgi:hypothetical protein